MKFYFTLQYKMMNRRLREFGIHPLIGYISMLVIYLFGSYYLFEVTEMAVYIYPFLALFFVGRFSETDRNDFLKSINTIDGLRRIRLTENSAFAAPFLGFLVYQQEFLISTVVLLLSILLALVNIRAGSSRGLPTPFSKRPFEFSTGFRRTWPVILLSYFLTYMAVATPNFGIGLVALIFIFLTCASYFVQPENDYYVWVFSKSTAAFLRYKIKTALVQMTLICAPVLVALSIFFWTEALVLIPIMFASYVYLATLIYAKYSAFPDEMSVPQGMLYALSVAFPPMLLFAIPYFYRKSNSELSSLLK